MRILTVNTHFAPLTFGGATVVVEGTAQALAERGHEVIVLTSLPESLLGYGQLQRYEAKGLPVVAVGRRTARTADDEYHQPQIAARIQQVVAAVRPDIVHFHAVQGLGVEMVRGTVAAGIPTVVTAHDAWWLCERQFMVRPTLEWCGQDTIDPTVCSTCVVHPGEHRLRQAESLAILNACQRVLAPSDYWRGLLQRSGVSEQILEVNPNGVTHPRPDFRHPARSGAPVFGYVGGADPVKGSRQLRAAMQALGDLDYSLLLADAGQALAMPGIRPEEWPFPQCRIIPAYTANTIDDFFAGIDVLLFPSQTRESYGLTVREALLRGVWVVASAGGGTAEVLVDGMNSTVLPMDGGAQPLTDAMRAIISRPDDYRNRVLRPPVIPDHREQAEALERIYRDVVLGAPAATVPMARRP